MRGRTWSVVGADRSLADNAETGASSLRTLEFSLPTVLAGHVDIVAPTTFFGFRTYKSSVKSVRPLEESSSITDAAEAVKGCSSNVNPTCLSNLYSFADADDYDSGLFGIAGFLYAFSSSVPPGPKPKY